MSHIYRKQHGCMIKDRSNIVLVRKSLWMICYVLLMVMHALEMHALEMHALEMHALEMHALEMHALEMHALEMHALEMHAPENAPSRKATIFQDAVRSRNRAVV